MRMTGFSLTLVFTLTVSIRAEVPKELGEFIAKADKNYEWKLKSKAESPAGEVYELSMTSQKWQDTTWNHGIQVFVPKGAKPQKTMVLYNTGGAPSPTNAILGLAISERVKAPVAFLYGIPNQPIYGKKEDALIAETFTKYLETEDASWPLLFPMAKSLIRAMDTLQAFAKEEWKFEVTDFVVTGASKRGWTSWLTAATGDKRVKAIVPMVIDTLNFKVQMPHQLESFGAYSLQIQDYVQRGLLDPKKPETPAKTKLWSMVDPLSYKENLKLPKIIINGTNDPYWTQDALNFYWDELSGPKWVLYVPNAGHGLDEVKDDGKKDRDRVLNTLSAASRWFIEGKKPPEPKWKHGTGDDMKFSVDAGESAKGLRFWTADSETRDFRKSKWNSVPLELNHGEWEGKLERPKAGFRACFAEFDYVIGDLKYTLSTQIRILAVQKK